MGFIERGRLLDDPSKKVKIEIRDTKFVFLKGVLYKWSLDGILLWCITTHGKHEAISEVHSGIYGASKLGPKLDMQLKRYGYYRPTLTPDCVEFAKKFQIVPISWKFYEAMDRTPSCHRTIVVIPSLGYWYNRDLWESHNQEYKYILAAMNYLSKWAEDIAVRDFMVMKVAKFIQIPIII